MTNWPYPIQATVSQYGHINTVCAHCGSLLPQRYYTPNPDAALAELRERITALEDALAAQQQVAP